MSPRDFPSSARWYIDCGEIDCVWSGVSVVTGLYIERCGRGNIFILRDTEDKFFSLGKTCSHDLSILFFSRPK